MAATTLSRGLLLLVVLAVLPSPALAKKKVKRRVNPIPVAETSEGEVRGADFNPEFDLPDPEPEAPPPPTLYSTTRRLFTGINGLLFMFVVVLGAPLVIAEVFKDSVKIFSKGDRVVVIKGSGKGKRGEVTSVHLREQFAQVLLDGKKKPKRVQFANMQKAEKQTKSDAKKETAKKAA